MSQYPPSPTPPTPEPPDWPEGADETPEERIQIQVDHPYVGLVDTGDLMRAVAAALAAEGHPDAQLTLVVTGDQAVQALNAQYRGLDEPTDVLSFSAQEATPGFVSAPEASAYLGDIVVAFPFTQRQAAGLGRSLRDEMRLLAVHGTLHLLGYDHGEPEEEAEMWARQDAIVAHLEP